MHFLLVAFLCRDEFCGEEEEDRRKADVGVWEKRAMGSLAMMASSLVGVGAGAADRPSASCHRKRLVVAKVATQAQAAGTPDRENVGRRAAVFAAAAVALCAIDRGMASADEEPKPGTAEAKRKYAPICVTMPTAKICHK
ncbi:hypothetical protein GW17_00059555 [Ensete ventricosum]|nr:hypothetical protein GW17_00059555 [Ensete ventricosum]RZS01576.1 hypothetical protein BHM03_00031466 [Ensete ventricosum]